MSATSGQATENDNYNLVEIWLRKDPSRWIAGAFAGVFAALVMWAYDAVLQSSSMGGDIWFIPKVFAIPILGSSALELGFHLKSILVGAVCFGFLSIVLGVVYAHMTGTNRLLPLFGMGLTWGSFSWIFINNLFASSWREVFALNIPKGAAFGAWMFFGIALVSVAFFDRIFRRGKPL